MEEDIRKLIEQTTELCNGIAQLLLRSEERSVRANEAFEKTINVLTTLSEENQAQRKEYDSYMTALIADRNQIRQEYKALVNDCLEASKERTKEAKRDREMIKELLDRLSASTIINNKL